MSDTKIRNICIIAHVDHGKTTLVDHLLRQTGTFAAHETLGDRVMDSMDLERERGITIQAKNTSVRLNDLKINIVDTPGHADFGGEVERTLGMADGSLLLVDAAEGPLPQTRFVLQKALAKGHKIILVINKVDRPECRDLRRIREVINMAFDLFVDLNANEEQLDFPIVYACAREGWCTLEENEVEDLVAGKRKATLKPLFDLVAKVVPAPKVDNSDLAPANFRLLISNISYSEYVGKLAIGRIYSGTVKKNQRCFRSGQTEDGRSIEKAFIVSQVFTFEGLEQTPVEVASAGDIVVIAGAEDIEIGDTLSGKEALEPFARIRVDKPTIGMIFSVNTSPLSGRDGEAIQSRKLRERLLREVRHNVALRFEETEWPDRFRVLGRGELQFSILIEQMRREGFEFMVGKPTVLFKTGEQGEKLEPFERLVLDLPQKFVSDVTQLFQSRKGILTKYETGESGAERVRVEFEIPTRGLLGARSKYLTLTKGEGLISSEFLKDLPHKGTIIFRVNGAMISDRAGETMEYALLNLEERGVLFVDPQVEVYEGMVIGECNKETDLNVNPCREKKLTNIRAAHAELLVRLQGIRKMSLEQCLEWIDEDEWIEFTPKTFRIRKKVLPANLRSVKREGRP